MRRPKQFLITGCGHQGTGWAARAMTLLGHPTGHEWVYRPNHTPHWVNLEGESSWPAASIIPQLPRPLVIMHLVRHPEQVVASVHNSNFLRTNCTCGHPPDAHKNEPYVQYILNEYPQLWDIQPDIVRATAWVVYWNRLVEANSKDRFYRRFKIEEISTIPAKLVEAATFLTGIVHDENLAKQTQQLIPKNFNTHRKYPEPIPTIEDIPKGFWLDQLKQLIHDYGYEENQQT